VVEKKVNHRDHRDHREKGIWGRIRGMASIAPSAHFLIFVPVAATPLRASYFYPRIPEYPLISFSLFSFSVLSVLSVVKTASSGMRMVFSAAC